MAMSYFGITQGLSIDDTLVLQGTGAPGSSTDTNNAPVGSVYMRNDTNATSGELNLQLYWKHTTGSGTNKWTLATSKDYVDAMQQGLSWREPATVKIDTADTLANILATINGNAGVEQGETLVAGDRILLSDVSDVNQNVFVVGGTQPNLTLTEDSNTLTDGDALLITNGTHADEQWTYDLAGTAWIQFGGATSNVELAFIRAFIGKDVPGGVGLGLPDYGSNDIVVDSNSLESEIGRLDDAVGTLTFTSPNVLTSYSDTFPTTPAVADITTNLAAIDAAFGTGAITNQGAGYVLTDDLLWGPAGALTVTGAVDALNTQIGDRNYTGNILTDGQTVTASLEALDVIVGDLNNSSVYTTGGYLTPVQLAGNSVQATVDSFNQAIGDLVDQGYTNTVTNITTITPVDNTLPTSVATEALWLLQYRLASNGARRAAMEIHAVTDGTNVDFSTFARQRLGAVISGVVVDVTINAGNWEVNVTSTSAINVTTKRLGFSLLA